MTEASLISCIVPVFNGERFIREAIDSILAQSYRPLEIIVVDDGSTDGTAAVVAGYRERVLYSRQTNSGPPAARNAGVDLSQGEFIAFLDADDVWHREKLARQMASFRRQRELDLCMTHMRNFWAQELQNEKERLRNHAVAREQLGPSQTFLARRALFDTVGQFNESLWHRDTMEWLSRVHDAGRVVETLPEVLVYRRMHENNISRCRSSVDHSDLLEIVKARLDRRRGKGAKRSGAAGG